MVQADAHVDVALIGGGIMSATLATLLRKLDPGLRMVAYERLDHAAAESSDAWNNAGTGHSGFCELNYTPAGANGAVDCSKALKIAAQFQQSLELWRALAGAVRGRRDATSVLLRGEGNGRHLPRRALTIVQRRCGLSSCQTGA
jgi:L-2-hydroxyglutarate oxidase LhgO